VIEIAVAGVALELHASRAAHWPGARTLLVADPHFGKAASFRAAGVFVPEATTPGALSRLDHLIEKTGAHRIVFLGDFLHAKEGRHPDTLASLNTWREIHRRVDMIIIRGNHDRGAGDPPRELRMHCVDGPMLEAPFAFTHHPRDVAGHYVIAGHVHPAARLAGAARQHARLSCFWFRDHHAVLPAFGEFTGFADIEPARSDRVFVIAEDEVLETRTASQSWNG
jgi:DNA ligase-associated metallophosphoesterase